MIENLKTFDVVVIVLPVIKKRMFPSSCNAWNLGSKLIYF